jgi:hypothetical protein
MFRMAYEKRLTRLATGISRAMREVGMIRPILAPNVGEVVPLTSFYIAEQYQV